MKKETRCAVVISLISFSFHLHCMFGSLLFLDSSSGRQARPASTDEPSGVQERYKSLRLTPPAT